MNTKIDNPKVFSGKKNQKKCISVERYVKGEISEERLTEGEILITVEGQIMLSTGHGQPQAIQDGMLVFLFPDMNFCLSSLSESITIRLKINNLMEINGRFHTEESGATLPDAAFPCMEMKQEMEAYVNTILAYHKGGIENPSLYDVKTKELLILLEEYYPEQELASFFRSLSSSNPRFSRFVLENYHKIKTVKEFAEKANVSVSGFEKEFRKTFNMPPYKWMKQKRTELLLYQISYGDKPLKVVCEECGFSSASQMSDFCKKEWGLPPGKIRRGKL